LKCKEINSGADKRAGCTGDEPCDESHCEGDRLVLCSFGNVDLVENCAQWGVGVTCLSAAESGRDAPLCGRRAAERECDDVDDEATCAGSSVRYCAYGRWREVDCAAFDGATCELRSQGPSGFGYDVTYSVGLQQSSQSARCRPSTP